MALNLLTANDLVGQYPASFYAATTNEITSFQRLEGVRKADICVIGGGYTGLSCALHLAKAGRKVALLDAQRVGWGASGRNGGQVGTGQRRNQNDLEQMVGRENAQRLWEIALDARELVHDLIKANRIKCDLKPGVLHADHKRGYVNESWAYCEKIQREYGYEDLVFLSKDEINEMVGSEGYFGGSLDRKAAHLHPLNFALGLAQAAKDAGVQIFEESRAVRLEIHSGQTTVSTAQGEIRAESVVLACNGYLGDFGGEVTRGARRRIMPINNFIIATEPLSDDLAKSLIRDDVAVADSRFVINYFRLASDPGTGLKRLLFGGGENYRYRFPKDIKAFVRRPMLDVFPQLAGLHIDYGWGGTLAVTRPRMPAFQRLGSQVYSAGGYSGHGVAMATLGGKIMADAIMGDQETFDLFEKLPINDFPGGASLRWPLLALAMTYYAIRDRL